MVEKGWKGFRPERTGCFSPMATPWENENHAHFFALKGQVEGLEGLEKV
jgi:hypothetical protein